MLSKRQALIGYITYTVAKRVATHALKRKGAEVAAKLPPERKKRRRVRWLIGVPLVGAVAAGAAVLVSRLRRPPPQSPSP